MAAESSEAHCSSEDQEIADAFLPGFSTFEDYSKALITNVMTATKSANKLPQEGDDFDYYLSFPGFQTFTSKMSTRVDRLVSKMIRHQQLPCYWGVEEEGGVLENSKSEEKFDTLIEANDILLERASMLLDEAAGLRKNVDQPVMAGQVQQGTAQVASWNHKGDASEVGKYNFIHCRNVPRPQTRFRDQTDNSNNPFIPRLTEKPNARVPLPDVYEKLTHPNTLSALIANAKEWAGSEERFSHPYKFELDNFEPLPHQLELKDPQLPGSLEDTPLTFIDSLEDLEALKEELKGVKEFAIDLEHHSYRTFLGITCLMQISTRFHDYLIDTLQVRHHMSILLDPFTNPAIVKVMHGAEFDMHWMQRDFGLYVVNLFDTGQASRVLQLPKFSLAFLLNYCCQVQADKQYQLADWRIRPLPQEMVKYAREDTHYLLYVYDRMRNELVRRNEEGDHFLSAVLERSKGVCLRLYQKPVFENTGYLKLYNKHKRTFNSQQLHCLQLLHAWRDHLARDEDESPGYVLPNHMMFQISEILPREPGGVLACCNPIPILLRQQQQEVFLLVRKARDTPPTDMLPTCKWNPKTKKVEVVPEEEGEGPMEEGEVPMEEGPMKEAEGQMKEGERPTKEGEGQDGSAEQRTRTGATKGSERTGHTINVTGPPVRGVEPVASILKASQTTPLRKDVAKMLKDMAHSFPDILSQYQAAKKMTPDEVLIQQQLAYEALSLSTRAPPPDPHVAAVKQTSLEGSEVTGKRSKKEENILSFQDQGDYHTPQAERPRKKPRPMGGATVAKDFQPFEYKGSNFTEYTRDRDRPMEAYEPHSADSGRGTGGRGSAGKASRSRVQQKSGQRSHTFTPRRSVRGGYK